MKSDFYSVHTWLGICWIRVAHGIKSWDTRLGTLWTRYGKFRERQGGMLLDMRFVQGARDGPFWTKDPADVLGIQAFGHGFPFGIPGFHHSVYGIHMVNASGHGMSCVICRMWNTARGLQLVL